jgi:two-component system OmpR family response regulator
VTGGRTRPVVLLVEDEEGIRVPLRDLLEREGYTVVAVSTLREAKAAARRDAPDVLVVDWMLPDGQGIDLLEGLRRGGSKVPVIFLSARAELVDKVVALELGADDYVTKPFEPRELLSRIRARLRGVQWAEASPSDDRIVVGRVALSRAEHEVRFDDQLVTLTRMEFALLDVLLHSPGRVFTREELLNLVWGYDSTPTTRTVDTHVLQLRTKLEPGLIESVRGIGYRLTVDGKERAES